MGIMISHDIRIPIKEAVGKELSFFSLLTFPHLSSNSWWLLPAGGSALREKGMFSSLEGLSCWDSMFGSFVGCCQYDLQEQALD